MKRKILITLIAFFAITLFSFDRAFDLKASIERGKSVYEMQCMTCHLPEGEGLAGVYPPLAKSDYLADKNRLVKLLLLGVRGPMKVNDVEYNGEMIPLSLNDEQVSDVLNYIRNTWGNKGTPVLPADIQPALKAKTKDFQPY